MANYSSYSRGINGLMIDVAQLPDGPLTADDFVLRAGAEGDPANWDLTPAPLAIDVRRGDGSRGSHRISIVFADGAIRNQWLQVTLAANARTGLSVPDVFYFGNAVAEVGDDPANMFVDANDEIAARNHPKTFRSPAAIDDRHDFNRDGFVNAADQILARSSASGMFGVQLLMLAPAGFNSGGIQVQPVQSGDDQAWAVAIRPDNKIIVAGSSTLAGSDTSFAVTQFRTDGQVDTAWATAGKAAPNFHAGVLDNAYAAVLDASGRLILGGQVQDAGALKFGLSRFTAQGQLDLSFSGDGIMYSVINQGNAAVRALALQPDGKIIAVGESTSGGVQSATVARYDVQGSLDLTFDDNGKQTIRLGSGASVSRAVVMQPDGKIVVGTSAMVANVPRFQVDRLLSDGAYDTTFDDDGHVTRRFGIVSAQLRGIALQSDGRILAAGSVNNGASDDFFVARYNSDGELDTTFGVGGSVLVRLGPENESAESVVVQPDGKILLAGSAVLGGRQQFGLVRLERDGRPDVTFGTDGIVLTPIGAGDASLRQIALQGDGSIVAVGTAVGAVDQDFAVVRYFSNGELDSAPGGANLLLPNFDNFSAASVPNGAEFWLPVADVAQGGLRLQSLPAAPAGYVDGAIKADHSARLADAALTAWGAEFNTQSVALFLRRTAADESFVLEGQERDAGDLSQTLELAWL
jgi:uncharacterized delta-60 repeat protein